VSVPIQSERSNWLKDYEKFKLNSKERNEKLNSSQIMSTPKRISKNGRNRNYNKDLKNSNILSAKNKENKVLFPFYLLKIKNHLTSN